RDPDTRPARQTREAWPPAAGGATRFFVVPAPGRDPDKAARHACEGLDSGLRRSDEDRDRIALNLEALKITRRPGARPGSRHKTGAQGARSLASGLRRSDEDVIVLPWMWRRSTFFVVPAPGRDPDTRPARHAREAWAPASAGATRMESRCLGSGDTQHSSSSRRQAGIQT